jgi:hypothetical protein
MWSNDQVQTVNLNGLISTHSWQYLCLMRAAAMAIPSDGEAGMSSLSAAFSSPSELSSAPEISSPSPSPPPYPAATIQFSTIETSAATRSSIQDPGVSENREGHAIGEVASKHNSMDRLSVILEENEDLVKEKMIEEGKVEGKSANGKQTTNGKDNGTKMVEGGQKKETMKSKEQAVEEELEESEVMKEYRTDGDENAWLIDSLDDF